MNRTSQLFVAAAAFAAALGISHARGAEPIKIPLSREMIDILSPAPWTNSEGVVIAGPVVREPSFAAAARPPLPLRVVDFGIRNMQCISSPAAPAGTVLICEGAASRIPIRALGHEVALAKPVRAYVEKQHGAIVSISLDGDELSGLGQELALSLQHAFEDLTRCVDTPELRVRLSPAGYAAVARIPVPAQFAPSAGGEGVALRTELTILSFRPATARIECDTTAPRQRELSESERSERARRVAKDL